MISNTGNEQGAKWLQNTPGDAFTVHMMHDLYSWVHVDSTIMSIRPGLVVLNAERVDEDKVPRYSKHGIRYGTQKKCALDSPCLEDYVSSK